MTASPPASLPEQLPRPIVDGEPLISCSLSFLPSPAGAATPRHSSPQPMERRDCPVARHAGPVSATARSASAGNSLPGNSNVP